MGRLGWSALVLGWTLLVGGGWLALARYNAQPGDPGDAPAHWPEASSLTHAEDRPTLLVWAHPRCPCTDATLAELARLMAVLDDRVQAEVVFLMPDDGDETWEDSALWRAARAIPRVTVVADRGSVEAGRFGAVTSGHAELYGPDGELWFTGGLTASRGHRGDSVGRSAILDRVLGEGTPPASSSIFGCSLRDGPS